MKIEWAHMHQPDFDRLVELILYKARTGEGRVEAVNGRGGDGGIDVRIVRGSELEVVRLKFYLDGFPTSARGRRRAIRESFDRAAQLRPAVWTLVVPCTLSDPERAFVEGPAGGTGLPEIQILDRARLDAYLAAFPDIVEYWHRDYLLEAAKVFN
ncbi:hypothetical protein ACGF5O_48220 [Streptomyces sp. NPDC048291]|uniref:hypothetical protein n=1 Tax=Streptomyces sp. NPDC048291 TaxID=3365530 RepID=UPI00371E286B